MFRFIKNVSLIIRRLFSILKDTSYWFNPRNLAWQSAIAEGFAEANTVSIVITSGKKLLR